MKTKRHTKAAFVSDSILVRRFITFGVIISALMVALSIFVTVYFNPATVTERVFEKIARDYYENYYYDKFVSSISSGEFDTVFKRYEETGFAPVLLRQLLLYNNKKNSKYEQVFTGDYSCDKNETNAVFYPEEPYGRTDYRIETNLFCE